MASAHLLQLSPNDRDRILTATAGQTDFPTDFPVMLATDLRVQTRPGTSGAWTDATFGVDFTVFGAGAPTGATARFVVGRAAGSQVRLLGLASISRTTSVVTGGRFRSEITDQQIDRLYIHAQEARRDIDGIEVSSAAINAAVAAAAASASAADASADAAQQALDDLVAGAVLDGSVNAAKLAPATRAAIMGIGDGARTIEYFGAVGNNPTLDTAAFLDACEWFEERSAAKRMGGLVHVGPRIYRIGQKIRVRAPGTFQGGGAAFQNQYVNNALELDGSVLSLESGVNDDLVEFLINPALYTLVSDYRLNAGINDLCIHGNRGTGFAPTSRERNSVGHGVRVRGSRYVYIQDCLILWCAQDGVVSESAVFGSERGDWSAAAIVYLEGQVVEHNRVRYVALITHTSGAATEPGVGADWSTRWSSTQGAISPNNIECYDNTVLSNGAKGLELVSGDAICSRNTVGFNGDTGIDAIGVGVVSENLSWNNFGHGFNINANADTIVAVNKSYDNFKSGFVLGSALPGGSFVGNKALRNGAGAPLPGDAGYVSEPAPIDASGFFIDTDSATIELTSNSAHNLYSSNVKRQRYGFYFSKTATRARMDGCSAAGNVTENYRVAAPSNIEWHDRNAPSTGSHPGFTLFGTIDANAQQIRNVASISGDDWKTKTIAAGVMAAGVDSFCAVNPGAPTNLTDITTAATGLHVVFVRNISANAVTLVHDTGKLRLEGGANRTLAAQEMAMFIRITGDVFQQVGV